MPLPISKSEPPRPPDLVLASDGPLAGNVAALFIVLGSYLRQHIVWLNNEITQLRDVANWLLQQVNIRNLVPDSDIKDAATFWVVGAGWVVQDAVGAGGGRAFVLAGGPTTADVVSTAIVTTGGGNFYVLSGWIDASTLTAGTVEWLVQDAGSLAVLAEAQQTAGVNGRVGVQVTLPLGTTQVNVVLRAVGALTTGTVIGSQPQLEKPTAGPNAVPGVSATLYRSNVGV